MLIMTLKSREQTGSFLSVFMCIKRPVIMSSCSTELSILVCFNSVVQLGEQQL